MSRDLPRMERVPAEGPTYTEWLRNVMAQVDELKGTGVPPTAVAVCGHPGHHADVVVAEVWQVGNAVLWRAEHPARRDGDALVRQTITSLERRGIDWKAAGLKFQNLTPKYVTAHLLNVPPTDRVDCTEVEGIDLDGNTTTAWLTTEWTDGTHVWGRCPKHGTVNPEEMVVLAAVARQELRIPIT